ncbi:GIP [Symbiodinium sp. KB8]|nr:GIP [Symbiodinium sp. KB8]
MHFEDVWTTRNGGAIASIFIVSRGNITFKDVYARDEGGAVFLHKYQTRVGPKQKRFKETLEKLTEDVVEYTLGGRATRDYGVYRSDYLALGESRHVFQNCKASLGGAIHAAGAVRMKGHVEFRDVMATTVRGGAAVSSHLMSVDRPVTIINASVPDGGVFCMQRAFRASMMTFINATAPQIQCASRLRIIDVSVTGTTASLMAPQRKIQRLTCDNGLEGYLDRMETGCHRCRPGFFQLQGGPEIRNDNQVTGHNCIQAPMGSEQIDQILQIRPGFMVARSNLSTSLRCPNVMACPGGQLMADQGVRDMCEHGYEGRGCVNCQKSSHGRVTNNPFACAACAQRPFRKVFQWTWFILQNSGIFAISASGVLMVEQESYKSTILTNQLMSYVTVSLPVLTAVMYSQTFRNTAEIVQDVLRTLQIPVEIADSGGGEGLSVQCLLGYIGLKKTLYGTDVVFAATALCLMAILGWLVDFWSAVVVGFNCFLPRICFCLGRHLVCYRMLPQAQGGEMVCGFEEDAHIPKPMACVMMVVCFLVGAGMWAVLLRYRGDSSSPGVMYLTNAYTTECRMWEITVLLRKMALMAVNAILPVTLHASMQMECISVILLISLVMNHRCAPYVSKAWNNGESVLLVLALATVSLTSCYKANELDWSRSATNQQVMMIIIILMATGPAVILGIQITIALYRELTEVPAPAESKEPKGD